jgi:hypothetical protein
MHDVLQLNTKDFPWNQQKALSKKVQHGKSYLHPFSKSLRI